MFRIEILVIFLFAASLADTKLDIHEEVSWRHLPGKKLHSQDTGINFGPFRKLNVLDDEGVIVVSNLHISKFTELVLKQRNDKYDDRSTYVVDLNKVVHQYNKFKAMAPDVEVHYAIKANSDPYLSYMMARLGSSFDCASKAEIEAVIDGLRVDPSRIIFANTAKSPQSIEYAADKGVKLTIFDNASELDKLVRRKGDMKLLIRLLAVVKKAKIPFSDKFGAMMDEVPCLLRQAKERGLDVIGVHFHLGEGLADAQPFDDYVKKAKKVFDIGKKLGFKMAVLDIGGGFVSYPSNPGLSTEEMIATVNRSMAQVFKGRSVRLLAEPGRYFAAPPFDLYVDVINRRLPHDTETSKMVYYINEPWSGQLNLFSYYDFQKVDRATRSRDDPFVNCLPLKGPLRPKDSYDSLLYGPSCHPHDRYNGTPSLPLLNVGDKIRFQAHGAYSVSDGTRFNGFQMPKVFYTIKPEYEHLLK